MCYGFHGGVTRRYNEADLLAGGEVGKRVHIGRNVNGMDGRNRVDVID